MDTEQTQPIAQHPRTHGDPRARRLSKVFVPVVVALLVGFSILSVYLSLRRDTLPEEVEGLVTYPDLRYEVVEGPIDYDIKPPPGGPNAGIIQECGRYRVPVQDENAVASLAIGAVWIAYHPDLPAEDIDALEDLVAPEYYVILAPYPDLKAPIVLTAWGAQVEVESAEDLRIPVFIRDFQERGDVPRAGERCVGGVSIPNR